MVMFIDNSAHIFNNCNINDIKYRFIKLTWFYTTIIIILFANPLQYLLINTLKY